MTSSLILCLFINGHVWYKRRLWVNTTKPDTLKTTGRPFYIMPTNLTSGNMIYSELIKIIPRHKRECIYFRIRDDKWGNQGMSNDVTEGWIRQKIYRDEGLKQCNRGLLNEVHKWNRRKGETFLFMKKIKGKNPYWRSCGLVNSVPPWLQALYHPSNENIVVIIQLCELL